MSWECSIQLTNLEFWLCVLCIAFGFMILFGQFYLLYRLKNISSDDIVKNSTITVVIIGALILDNRWIQ